MARKSTKFLWQQGDITITDISDKLKRIIKDAPKDDKQKAQYISGKLKSKEITADEAAIIIARL